MSNLTDLLPAGAGGKQVSFVASGTLSSGQTVVLNTDGTVSSVGFSDTPYALQSTNTQTSAGSDVGDGTQKGLIYNPKDAVWVSAFIRSDNERVDIVLGTETSTGISWGSPTTINSTSANSVSVFYDAVAERVGIVFYEQTQVYTNAAIITSVSGTTPTVTVPTIACPLNCPAPRS
jgi:hypothetical protein